MNDDEILANLEDVFRNVFENDAIILTPHTTKEEIPGWDSMSNITLVIEIEHCFGIKIKNAETEALQDVGALIALVKSHMAPAVS